MPGRQMWVRGQRSEKQLRCSVLLLLAAHCTFSLVAELVIVLPQLGDQLGTLQLDLRVGGQVVGRGSLLDHGVSLHIQVPIDAGGGFMVEAASREDNHASREEEGVGTHTAGL